MIDVARRGELVCGRRSTQTFILDLEHGAHHFHFRPTWRGFASITPVPDHPSHVDVVLEKQQSQVELSPVCFYIFRQLMNVSWEADGTHLFAGVVRDEISNCVNLVDLKVKGKRNLLVGLRTTSFKESWASLCVLPARKNVSNSIPCCVTCCRSL